MADPLNVSDSTVLVLLLLIAGLVLFIWLLIVLAIYSFFKSATLTQKVTAAGFLFALFAPGWLLAALGGLFVGLLLQPRHREPELRFDSEGKILGDDAT